MSGIRSVLLSCGAAVLLLTPALFAPAAQAEQAGSRTITGTYEPGSADKVQLDIPFGEVRVEGVDGGSVRVKLHCKRSHATWHLGHDRQGSHGEDSGLREDVSIDMGAGEVSVRMAERAVQSVDVNLALGETVIHQGGRTREYTRVLGGPVRWTEGEGDAGIEVNLGAGEVEVTLE